MPLFLLDIFIPLSQSYYQSHLFPRLWFGKNVYWILLSPKTSWCKWRKLWTEDLCHNTNSRVSSLGHSASANLCFLICKMEMMAVLLPQSWGEDLLEEKYLWKYLRNIAACKYRGPCFLEPSPLLCFPTYLLSHSWHRWSGSMMVIGEIQ